MHRFFAALGLMFVAGVSAAQTLEQQFAEPAAQARPRVWWHWIDGNVTRDGITRDLEWMKRSGIAGFQMFDVGRAFPTLVDQRIDFMSPEWKHMLRHAASEAGRLDLEMTLASSAGWSVTGGPDVAPASAMKKLVWSERRIRGGEPFSGRLPSPPSNNGPFQDLGRRPPFRINGEPRWAVPQPQETHYADVRVLAFPMPAGEGESVPMSVSASAGQPDATLLRDGRYDAAFVMPIDPEALSHWILFDFGGATTIRSLRLGIRWPEDKASPMPEGWVEASDDGVRFRSVQALPSCDTATGLPLYTLSLPETRARYFRVVLTPGSGFSFPGLPLRQIAEFQITEMDLSEVARPHRHEAKAGYAVLHDYATAATAPVSAAAAIDPGQVVDLTSRLRADGVLEWMPPPGDWIVIRLGYSLTGQVNAPATAAGTGYEVDKYSEREVRRYLDGYYGEVLETLDGLSGTRGLRALLVDSFEAGQANWTPRMIDEFRARRGYDPTPWLPVLTGRIVGSAEASDRFLWDFRRTLADLLAESHYKTIAEYAAEHDLGFYGEAMGVDLPTTGDGLQAKRYPSIPMGEFWQVAPDAPSQPNHVADIREAASAAHVYGQNIVAAEAFTGFPLPGVPPPYTTTPWLLKPLADRFMALGVNQFIIHTAVHQPLERPPGFTLSIFGQYFSRHETWAEMARGWIDYLARSSALLQQGLHAADIAYFYGEGAAVTVPAGAATDPVIPKGYAFDFVGRDMLLHDFAVVDGALRAPSGTSYRVLVLPSDLQRITLPLLRKLDVLVRAGAVLVGPRPQAAAGLTASDDEIAVAAQAIWGELDGRTRTMRRHGRGRVYWTSRFDEVLESETLAPDVEFSGAGSEHLVWIHRHIDDGELYFIANQRDAEAEVEASLRATGRAAELWSADDARMRPATFRQSDGRTQVPLRLGPYEAVFVVLREQTTLQQRSVPAPRIEPALELDGKWTLEFARGRGAPEGSRETSLTPWTESAEPGIRYYSGTATYRTTFDLAEAEASQGRRLLLDLGRVHELARVQVNGIDAGIAWKPPYRVDIGAAVRPGRNTLSVEVANLWANRFVGDLQPDATKRHAFSTFDFYAPGLAQLPYTQATPLRPSGLLGPVRILEEQTRHDDTLESSCFASC